jgi:primosomal protein N' (replication factor Y) (superfamily II helicase)
MSNEHALIRVAVPVPLADAFDYLAPAHLPLPEPGCRVRVPFGRGERIGIVLEHPATTDVPAARLKRLGSVLDERPAIGAELLASLRWAADYYHHPVGEVLSHALPGLLREGRAIDEPPEAAWQLTELGRAQDVAQLPRGARQQARTLNALRQRALAASELKELEIASGTLARLAAKGWIEPAPPPDRSGLAAPHALVDPQRELTADQRAVLTAIAATQSARKGFRAYLLHGVTGSGKTEIYLRLIADELAAGRQTLLLVPEIGLTPQLVRRLHDRFGEELAVLHSAVTERERFDAWRRAYRCEARLVVGTRSAVFAPLPSAGLVIVDEEHDASYKQQTGFRYSARDLAVVRAQRLNVPVVLGSATPSLETFNNAVQGRYEKLSLPRRIGSAGVPRVRVVDLNRHASRQALSTPLVTAIAEHLGARNQVLLFLNRRGFAPALFCPECKAIEQCRRCDAGMTVHLKSTVVRCHHCGAERALDWTCHTCGGERIAVGAGTQRVGDELAGLFPQARVARLDRDSTSRKGALAAVLNDVEAGNVEILIGTQMLTKGHDFPRVTLVGVLNADQGLFGTDPRSHERLAQTILQVAGRAGRADRPGEVVIQTHYPDHPLLKCLLESDYATFATLALAERREAHWPPFAHLAVWHAEAPQRAAAVAFLERVRDAATAEATPVDVLGPAALPMERKDGRYRAQLLFRSADRAPLHRLVQRTLLAVRNLPDARRARWTVDIDPLEV